MKPFKREGAPPTPGDWFTEEEKKRKALLKRTVKHLLKLNEEDRIAAEAIMGKRKDTVPRNVILLGVAMMSSLLIIILIISFPSHKPQTTPPDPGPAITHNPKLWYTNTSYPVKLSDWQQRIGPRSQAELTDKIKAHYLQVYKNTPFGLTAFATLPRESEGATSDPDKLFLKDKFNLEYSSWTYESLIPQVGVTIDRLLNGEFGGWKEYQYSSTNAAMAFPLEIFSDVFSPSFITSLEADKTATPIYADWAGDDFGLSDELLDSKGARWLGVPTEVEGEFVHSNKLNGYQLKMNLQVDFQAFTQEKKVLHRKATLELTFHPAGAQRPWAVDLVKARLLVET